MMCFMKTEKKVMKYIIILICLLVLSGCADSQSKPTAKPKAASVPYHAVSTAPAQETATVDPYVGMRVSTVPSAWNWQGTDNKTVKDQSGNKVKTTKYRYDTPTKIFTIWVNGSSCVVKVSVTEIGGKRETGRKAVVTPSLDVSGYAAPEDFYEYYYDDFTDFEDAEEYYYEHGGW